MYLDYFGFRTAPFTIAPDPQYLYMSPKHREALAHLMYGVRESGGFVVLTGEIGTGKTTLCRCLLERMPEQTDVAFILSPHLGPLELMAAICEEFNLPLAGAPASMKALVDRLYRFLLQCHAAGRKAVLIIDEAQSLGADVLEQLRLLTNLETSERKLLQILLLGQPQLRDLLEAPEMRQLSQRVTARYHLQPLSREEMRAYVAHRLAVAGCHRRLFTEAALRRLYQLTGGVPRVINLVCDRALMGAYARSAETVSPQLLRQAAQEVFGTASGQRDPWYRRLSWSWLYVLALMAGSALALGFHTARTLAPPPSPAPVATAVAPAPVAAPAPQPIEASAPVTLAAAEPERPWWPRGVAEAESRRQAYTALFRSWGLELTDATAFCEQAARQGVECLFRRGSLGSLRQFNSPAVLQLVSPEGETFYAALTALTADAAVVTIGTAERRVSLAELEPLWLGEFTLLWRPPAGYRAAAPAEGQPEVLAWVGRQLAQHGMVEGDLAARLRTFQARQGLPADGRIGPLTLIRLGGFAGVPRLADG